MTSGNSCVLALLWGEDPVQCAHTHTAIPASDHPPSLKEDGAYRAVLRIRGNCIHGVSFGADKVDVQIN